MTNTHVRRGRGGGGYGGGSGGGYRGGSSNGRGRGGGSNSWFNRGNGSSSANDTASKRDGDDAEPATVNEGGYKDDFGESAADDIRQIDAMDSKMGFARYTDGPEKLGWLVNMHPVGLGA
jgi:hypothetical protein